MHLDKQCNKIRIRKTYLNTITSYSSNNTYPLFKQVECYNICPLWNFKKFEQNHIFVCQPSSLPTGTDLESIPLCI